MHFNNFSFMSIHNLNLIITITWFVVINYVCNYHQQLESLKSNYWFQISINQMININESKLISIILIYLMMLIIILIHMKCNNH